MRGLERMCQRDKMKDKELKLEDVKVPHTLCGASDTHKYIILEYQSRRGMLRYL